ncbi:MAG TPA: quinone-dependent dihydroorotate dehydrogenase, partial [Polyangiaceae bacterium LLY-WYZ-15_(1-7)]|nr:quinone-dependent dihydroorotate dehydrogenase [Polyangiaceae bacterium LLY-WYZ-15_(1-7)]
FPTPVGLAAGFDKDAVAFEALGALGFGFVEVGTLTGEGQVGNPQPRLFRLPADRALINRMGFNNHGSAAAAPRLAGRRRTIVGVNVGKTKVVPEERAIEDYVASTRRLGASADYFVVNVSSPNTPGLRDLQAVEKLRPLLAAVRATLDEVAPPAPASGPETRGRRYRAPRRVPLLVKIAPDLADADVDAVAELALELGLEGIIATNTTIARSGLQTGAAALERIGAGGLSGAPLKARALEVMRRLRRRVGERLVLVGVGGIESVDDAWARIRAGATLVQLYTAFVYEGPTLPRRLALGLAERARAEGFERVVDAVGVDA